MLVGAPSSSGMVQMDCAGAQCDLNLTIPAAMIAPVAAKAMQVTTCSPAAVCGPSRMMLRAALLHIILT